MRQVTSHIPTTGLELKLRRVAAGVKAKAVAGQMGISSSRLSRIEVPEPVTDRMAARYLTALDACRTSGTSGGRSAA